MITRETTSVVRPYAKRGTKTAARETARKADQKTFLFTCHKHGRTVFGTAGQGHCRACAADRKRAAYERQKRAELAELCVATTTTNQRKEEMK
jgi:hypothetical protein